MGDRSAPSSSLSSPSPSFTGKSWRRLLPASHSRHSAPCAPTHPHTHTPSPIGAPSCVCVSLLPRGVSIPLFLPCASLPRPGPRLLIVQTQFSSLWLWPRVESGRPEPPPPNLEGRAGRRVKGEPKRRVEQVPRVVRGIPGSSGFSCIHRTGRLKRPRILCSLPPSPPLPECRAGVTQKLWGGGQLFPRAARGRGVGEVAPFPTLLSPPGVQKIPGPALRSGGPGWGPREGNCG